MQCKDIPDRPILEFLDNLSPRWAVWYEEGKFWKDQSVQSAMPKNTPEKLVVAKMRQMIHRKVVDGCPCGCRGDYEITDKGRAEL